MSMTLMGAAFVPLCAVFCLSPEGLLILLQVGGVFGAAAAVIIGGAGLQPAFVPAALFVAWSGLQWLLGAAMPGARQVLRLLTPMVLLGFYAPISAMILPRIFDGQFLVWPQKPEPPMGLPVLLHSGLANVTQSLYLLLDLTLLGAASIYLTPRPQSLARLLTVYLLCGYAVAALCLWQLANKLLGVPFPEDLLYSNPGWMILSSQALDGVPRISGSFAEPASLAFFLCGCLYACACLLIRGHRHALAAPLLGLTLLCLLISTSTTGFAVLAIGIVFGFVYGLRVAPARMMRLLRAAVPAVAVLFLGGAVVSTVFPGLAASAAVVAAETLAKGDSESFSERTQEDYDSVALFTDSYGLGIGWGSNRSSSLVPGLLGTLGVPGVLLPTWFALRLRASGRAPNAPRAPDAPRAPEPMGRALIAVHGFGAATLGSLLTAIVSAPIIVSAVFYLNLAALIAGLVQLRAARMASIGGSRGLACGLVVALSISPAWAGGPEFFAGVGTHFVQAPQTLEQGMGALRAGGFGSLRDEMYWNVIETRPGEFTFPPRWSQMVLAAQAQGLRPLLVLDYGNKLYDGGDKPRSAEAIAAFARYAATVAARFRGQSPLYEIWNEWNGGLGNTSSGTLGDYLPLLRATARAVKSADSNAIILSDGVLWSDGEPGVIEQAIRAGVLDEIDGIALHPYFYNRGPDHRPEAWAAYLRAAEARMRAANHGTPVTLFITETGWPSGAGENAISETLQAAYAARLYLLTRTMNFIGGLWWYDLRDDGREANFGLMHADFQAKPAFQAVSAWLTYLKDAEYLGFLNVADNLVGLAFRARSGARFDVIWSSDDQVHKVHFGNQDLTTSATPTIVAGDR